MPNIQLQKGEFWEKSWKKHIQDYLKAPPRAGIFIANYFKNIKTVLEIAGGSCRDSRYLANIGYKATGSDFDEKTLNYLQNELFINDKLNYSKQDAFNLTFANDSFDLIFHNGFFIYFNDEQIKQMLKEQARVAKKYIVFFVHNSKNKKLVKIFENKAKSDELYKVRFFNAAKTVDLIKNSSINYKNIKIKKFGGFYDLFYKKFLKGWIPNPVYPFRKLLIPKLYQLQKWENTERICCIVELEK